MASTGHGSVDSGEFVVWPRTINGSPSQLGIDATNDDILDQMRKMKSCREDITYSNIVCTVRGFADDKRLLFEIPEVSRRRRNPSGSAFTSSNSPA